LPKGRTLTLAIIDSTGRKIRDLTVNSKPGMHRATWDLRLGPPYISARPATGTRGQSNQPTGAFVLPGKYIARLSLTGNDTLMTQTSETQVVVNPDPLIPLSP